MSSIWAELADVARFTALETFIQRANRMGMVRGSRTREGTFAADRGTSAAAAPTASSAASPPVSSVEPPVRGPVEPQAAAGVPSPATVSPSYVSAVKCTGAIGEPPPSETTAGVVGVVGWPWWCSPERTVAWGGDNPVGEFREPALSPHRLQLFQSGVGVRMAPAFSDAVASPRRRAMKRATRFGCLSLRASTIPTLRSDMTLHSSLRAGCRAPFSRSIKRSLARNTSRATSPCGLYRH